MREPTIAAGFVRGLMELAVAKGASRDALAQRCGIDPAELQNQDNRIPLAKYVTLMRVGKELSNDPALALHFGEAFEMADLSVLGVIGRSFETVAEGFEQTNRYARLIVDLGKGDRFKLERDAGRIWIIDARENPNDFPEMTESTFARIAAAARRSYGRHFLQEVHVTHAAPAYRDEYQRIFDAPVVFESDKNALVIDEEWLGRRIALTSRDYVFGVLKAHADALLERLESATSTRGRVEGVLISTLHTGTTSMESTAEKLGMSRQTLFRKLKSEGATFERIVDELRRKLALHYLGEKKVSVTEAAYLVGFSEAASFSRAFKRWTGSSPRDARRA